MLERRIRRDFVAVTSSVAVLGLGVGCIFPLTALALNARGFGPDVVGGMVAAAALGGVAGTLISPWATLRFGRRRVMLTCVTAAALAVLSLQYTASLGAWVGLRALFGACMAPLFVLGEAWINTLSSDASRGRVVAIYSTSFTLCQVLGPMLANLAGRVLDQAFLICSAVFLLCLPGIALARESPADDGHFPAPTTSGFKDATASWLSIVRRAPAIIGGAAVFAAFDSIMLSFLPLFALDRGQTRSRALTALVIVLVGDATLQFAAGWLADRWGRAAVQRGSGVALCVLLPLLPLMAHLQGLWEIYLYVLGGVAGSLYTLSLVASGDLFRGAALVRASGLIALTWNLASAVGPAATGLAMQLCGSVALPAVLWLMALAFVCATYIEARASQQRSLKAG